MADILHINPFLLDNIDLTKYQDCVWALGNFDGLHSGHQKILSHTKDLAASLGFGDNKYGIITFDIHTDLFFNYRKNYLITPSIVVEKLYDNYQIPNVIVLNFASIVQYSPKEFVAFLVKVLRIRGIVVGEDFRFGYRRIGDVSSLAKLADEYELQFICVENHLCHLERCSSSRIRELLAKGDIIKVNQILGRPFSLISHVIKGSSFGAQMGFPTCNINIDNYVKLAYGVYITNINVKGVWYPSIANFGVRPTLHSGAQEVFEIHIFDTDLGDLYGSIVEVKVMDFIRSERKFASLDCLVSQIKKDVIIARKFFE